MGPVNLFGRTEPDPSTSIRPVLGFLDTDVATFAKTLDVNLTGMFLVSRAAVPHLVANGGGSIVNIGSGSGYGRPGLLAYGASKGGVFGLSAAMAYDLKPLHIRVNVVVPSGGLTGMTEGDPGAVERNAQSAASTVAGRPMESRDTANAVAFLLSDDADQISGAAINVGNFLNQGGGGASRQSGDALGARR